MWKNGAKKALGLMLCLAMLTQPLSAAAVRESEAMEEETVMEDTAEAISPEESSSGIPEEMETTSAVSETEETSTAPETEFETAGTKEEETEPAETLEAQESETAEESTETASESIELYGAAPRISYQTHVQTYNWQNWSSNGEENGTTGLAKRLEAIKIRLDQAPVSGSVEYRTHVQSFGWQNWVSDGAESGTTGLAKRLEAIQIRLTGEMAEKYDIYYRVHCQTYDWSGWAKNGAPAGSMGYAKRLEAIQIVLVEKGGAAPGATSWTYKENLKVTYQTHVQTYGWQAETSNGVQNGTTGQAKRLEGIKIRLENNTLVEGSVEYCTHVQTYGWKDWVKAGQLAGTTGEAKRLEAIRIRLTGAMAEKYDIYYRVHCQTFGWTGWGKNGDAVGSEGYEKRLEAIQIVLVEKGGAAPGSTANAFYLKTNPTLMEDKKFQENARGALANGLPIGGYVYSYASTPEEARKEAELAVKLLKGYQVTYPIVYDLEEPKHMTAAAKLNNMAMAKEFCSVLQAAGYKTWVYGSPSKLKRVFDYDKIASSYGIWLARYRWSDDVLQFSDAATRTMVKEMGYEGGNYTGLTNVEMWQYTEHGRVNGISGNVDLDLGYYPERWGVDVSAHQGTINWKRVKEDGAEFAMLRITQQYKEE
jgi:uncharacterized protein YjdB